MSDQFLWRDGGRLVVFRADALGESPRILAGQGWESFELATTPRALAAAPPELVEAAGAVHHVEPGPVPELASRVLAELATDRLVALGGGRVIDTAKAAISVRGGSVAAVPTTLSGAETTAIHRLPAGHEDRPRIRPALVIADPLAMTSLEEGELRASAMNALAHGAEALFTLLANPAASLIALRGTALIAGALDRDRASRPRSEMALGSLLCAAALDSAGYALHHVLCQTLVRVCATPHADTNATMLPHTIVALARRRRQTARELAAALSTDDRDLGERVSALGRPRRLGELGAPADALEEVVEAALLRPELRNAPDPPGRDELRELLDAAW